MYWHINITNNSIPFSFMFEDSWSDCLVGLGSDCSVRFCLDCLAELLLDCLSSCVDLEAIDVYFFFTSFPTLFLSVFEFI